MKVIGVCGTHSAGKTTLINDIYRRYRDKKIKVIEETAREINPVMFGTIEGEVEIYNKLLEEILKVDSCMEYDYVLTNRTFLDIAGYTIYFMSKYNWGKHDCIRAWDLVNDCMDSMSYYDMVVFADNIFRIPGVDDGFRMVGDNSRFAVDCIIRSLVDCLERNDIKVVRWNIYSELVIL